MSRLVRFMCASALLANLATQGIAADLAYRLTDLGDLTSDRLHGVTFTSAINNRGEIVGQSFNDQFQSRAFLWRRTTGMVDLGDLGYIGNRPPALAAFAINKHSVVVGSSMGVVSSTPARAFSWEKGRILNLGTFPRSGTDTYATGVNKDGDIVGAGYNSGHQLRALRWVRGIPTELGALLDGRAAVQAFGIGDHGQIVGYLSPGGAVSFAHGFIWEKGKFTDVGTLPGTNLSFANAVNDRGQVVGQCSNTATGTARAFLWERGAIQDLGTLAPTHIRNEARAINKKGTIVGSGGAGAVSIAWIWHEGVMQDLNKLISVTDPNRTFVTLVTATGINDKGEIVARGYDRRLGVSFPRGYLLTPGK